MTETIFVSMPFGENPESSDNEWTKLYEFGLKPLEDTDAVDLGDVPFTPVRLWRADQNLNSLALKTNVMRGIEQSSYVVCVLTTSVVLGTQGLRISNPNVLWEMGFAEALGKPIVVLADNDSLRQLPMLAGLPNVCIYDHATVQSVRSKDAPAMLRVIARHLVPYMAQASEDAKRGPIGAGRSRALVYASRDAIDLAGMIRGARRQVDILTTNLDYYLFRRLGSDLSPFESALANGATIRIVTMDPESVIAQYRAKQLVRGQDVPGYRQELMDGIVNLFQRFGDRPQFHLHIYDDLPLQITTRVDQTIITSIVTRGERARRRIQIQFNLHEEGVTESFVSHFQSMFDNSIDVAGVKWVLQRISTPRASRGARTVRSDAVGPKHSPERKPLRKARRPAGEPPRAADGRELAE